MKKFLAVLLVLAVPTMVWGFGVMSTVTTHNAVSIAKNTSSTSDAVDLKARKINGYFSVQVAISGDGTAKVEYLLSNDGVTYLEPTSASDITSGHTKTSGPGSDGNDLFSFDPEPARYIKIKVTETGNVNSITATVTLMMN